MLEINQIYNDDCLEGMKKIDDKSVDLILCDLPYGTTKCKWDIVIPFDKLWKQYARIIKDNGAIVLCGSEPFSSALRLSNLNLYKYDAIWLKDKPSNFANAKKRFLKYTEDICIFYKNQPTYNPQMVDVGKFYNKYKNDRLQKKDSVYEGRQSAITPYRETTLRYPKNIIEIPTPKANDKVNKCLHPTQKPVALFEYLIKTFSNEEELILDNCIGSGTTAIAALNTNRNFIGFELDENYFNIAKNRIEEACNQASFLMRNSRYQ